MRKYEIKDIYLGYIYWASYDEYKYETKKISTKRIIAFKRVPKVGSYTRVYLAEDILTGQLYPISGFNRYDYEKIGKYCPLHLVIGAYTSLSSLPEYFNVKKISEEELVQLVKMSNPWHEDPKENEEQEETKPVVDSFMNLILSTKEKVTTSDFNDSDKKLLLEELLTMAENYYQEMIGSLNAEGLTLTTRNIEQEYIQRLADFEFRTFSHKMELKKTLTNDLQNLKKHFRL